MCFLREADDLCSGCSAGSRGPSGAESRESTPEQSAVDAAGRRRHAALVQRRKQLSADASAARQQVQPI